MENTLSEMFIQYPLHGLLLVVMVMTQCAEFNFYVIFYPGPSEPPLCLHGSGELDMQPYSGTPLRRTMAVPDRNQIGHCHRQNSVYIKLNIHVQSPIPATMYTGSCIDLGPGPGYPHVELCNHVMFLLSLIPRFSPRLDLGPRLSTCGTM